MWQTISQTLTELNTISILVRLFLAVLLGGIIGLDRGIKGRAAGMRTYMLVCLGSALVMITNEYLAELYGSDPARLGAQVVSGIGFLGAGTIIITRDRQVRGLTTAAGLWASACMGLAIGVGFYSGALLGMLFIFIVTTVIHRLDIRLLSKSRSIDLYVELGDAQNIHTLLDAIREGGARVTYLEIIRPKYDDRDKTAVLLTVLLSHRRDHYDVLADFNQLDYVNYIEEV